MYVPTANVCPKVRIGTRMYEHINTDKGSSIYKHKVRNNLVITEDNFEILDRGFPKTLDRKLDLKANL